MKEQLKNDLLEYLGELMCESEATFDWIEKDKIINKINSVNILLNFNSKPIKSTMQNIWDKIKTL